jgi:hypothetical protein
MQPIEIEITTWALRNDDEVKGARACLRREQKRRVMELSLFAGFREVGLCKNTKPTTRSNSKCFAS